MKKIILFLMLIAGFQTLFAQNRITVHGTVLNPTGEPMVGVTVNVKGTAQTTVTQKEGTYSIAAAPTGVLVFSFIGHQTLELPIKNQTEINVSLQLEDKSLNEVVVIGYGTSRRKDLTGSVSSVKGDELAKVPVQNVAQALQGRLAGVEVTMADGSPGAEPSIKIRGGTSITQSNEPLYIVDGVPQTEGLSFLDPMDIESIDVLKDVSATAIYGARGANGVVLVTTKQTKAGKTTINYDGYVGVKKMEGEIPMMQAYEYLRLQYERALGDPVKMQSFTRRYGTYDSLQYYYGNNPGINWQDEVFGKAALSQYHKVSINGGGKETKFNLFYSRNDDKGILLNSASVKDIAKLTLNHRVGSKITVNAIVNYSNQKITGLPPTDGGNVRLNVLQNFLRYRPVTGRGASDEDLLDLDLDPYDPNPSSPTFQSPIIQLNTQLRERRIKSLNANTSITYKITNKLTYRGLVSYTDRDAKAKAFNSSESILAIRTGGAFGSISDVQDKRFNYNNTLTYNGTFNKHKLDLTAGQEYVYNYSEGFGASASAFPAANLGWNDMSLGAIAGFPTSNVQDDKLLSFFGRANYSFNSKYLITATVRADGSSKFAKENRWGYFPSIAAAWRIYEEEFMKSIEAVSDLKLRVSYGQAGNNRIANYAFLGIFNTGSYPLMNQVTTTAYQVNFPNPQLKWEANEAMNIGLDLGLFRQRIIFTADLYDNRSKNLLFNTRIPASSGFTTQFQNIGTTSSKGVEFTLNTVNIKNADFTWNTSFNIAFNRTKVLRLSQDENSLYTNSYTTTNDYILQVGQPVGMMFGYIKDGLYTVDDFNYNAANGAYTLKNGVVKDNITVQPGYIKFKDISGPNGAPDGMINEYDRTIIGNANPKFTGGLTNSFSYKGFDLNIFLNFNYGNNVYNANVLANMINADYYNTLAFLKDRFTTMNANGELILNDPTQLAALNQGKIYSSFNGNNTGRLYNDIIEDGSFLRINNVSLGYTLPKSFIRKAKISNARIYVTGYNLYTFTKYTGYDPEVSVINNAITPGVDFSAYPRARSFVAGISLSL